MLARHSTIHMKHEYQIILGVVLASVALRFDPAAHAAVPRAPEAINYARPFDPPTRPAFLPLPPGAVEPAPRDEICQTNPSQAGMAEDRAEDAGL